MAGRTRSGVAQAAAYLVRAGPGPLRRGHAERSQATVDRQHGGVLRVRCQAGQGVLRAWGGVEGRTRNWESPRECIVKTVWKYELSPETEVELPEGAKV